jgi:hypothetical protein
VFLRARQQETPILHHLKIEDLGDSQLLTNGVRAGLSAFGCLDTNRIEGSAIGVAGIATTGKGSGTACTNFILLFDLHVGDRLFF